MFELQASLVDDWVARTGAAPVRTPLPGTGGRGADDIDRPASPGGSVP